MTLRPIPWRVQRADDCWIGICDPLKLTVESGTLDELSEDVVDVTNAVFQSLRETGDLDRVLAENGLVVEPEMHMTLDIPFIPLAIPNENRATTAGR